MSKQRILLVEDDPSIAELVKLHLENASYEVDHVDTVRAGMDHAMNQSYQLVLLDLMLPDGDGMDVCRKLRMEKIQTPIIILTAKNEEIDKVLGLESGADDYVTKPFGIREFLARVKASIRRGEVLPPIKEAEVLKFADLEIDEAKRKVILRGTPVDLTKKEFDLLFLLAQNKGVSYTREKLLNLIWGYQFEGYEHTVNSHINRLRAKIEKTPNKPDYILTSWGVGYKFNDEL
ncbi:response regulator transcription factor [bacterium SCSIO 12643]|nr:response regulator transcription factor [bacterium SCSIO 12643]